MMPFRTMFDNAVIDIRAMAEEDAQETEREVYAAYLAYKENAYNQLRYELTEGLTPYNQLSKEYQVYQSNIVTLLTTQEALQGSSASCAGVMSRWSIRFIMNW